MQILEKEYEFGGITYLICSNGDIFGPAGNKLKVRKNEDGYAVVTMGSKRVKRTTRFVHRIVAEVFLPNPQNLSDVDHLDSDRMNPSLDNLEWVSHEENVRRAYERGGHIGRAVGEKNPRARLTTELVRELRRKYEAGITIQEMADTYGFPWNTIGNAVKGYTWKHIA